MCASQFSIETTASFVCLVAGTVYSNIYVYILFGERREYERTLDERGIRLRGVNSLRYAFAVSHKSRLLRDRSSFSISLSTRKQAGQ